MRVHVNTHLLLGLAPLALIEIGLLVYSLSDLYRPGRRVKGGSKTLWLLVILLLSTVGPLLYVFFGREAAEREGS